jgi:transcriptional regulator with XRE-family HTH domain
MEHDWYVQPTGERQDRFWTQEQLADAAGLRKRTVERAEAGRRLRRGTVQALAQALGLPAEALVRTTSPIALPQHPGPTPTPEQGNAPIPSTLTFDRTQESHVGIRVEWRADEATNPLAPAVQASPVAQAADAGIHAARHGASEAEQHHLAVQGCA